MAESYPSNPERLNSFTAHEQQIGNGVFPGSELDAEFAQLRLAARNLNDFVRGITRSDGALANGIVTRESLAADIRLGFNAPRPWEAGKQYRVSDTVFFENSFYLCTVAHTSGESFPNDLASGRWVLLANLTPDGGSYSAAQVDALLDALEESLEDAFATADARRAIQTADFDTLAEIDVSSMLSGEQAVVGGVQGGVFQFDSASSAPEDLVSVVAPNLNIGRWLRNGRLRADLTVTVGDGGDFPDLPTSFAALRHVEAGGFRINHQLTSAITKGLLLAGGDYRSHRLTSAIGLVGLAEGFQGVSNEINGWSGASAMATRYRSTKNLFVGWNCGMFNLACEIDMNSPTGSARLGHGINLEHCSMYIDEGAGVRRSGLSGMYFQNCRIQAIASKFTHSNAESIRCQQASSATFQAADLSYGMQDPELYVEDDSAALFVSRGSNFHAVNANVSNSGGDALEVHRAFFSGQGINLSNPTYACVVANLMSVVGIHGADMTDAGTYAVRNLGGSIVSIRSADVSGFGLSAIRHPSGAGITYATGVTSNTEAGLLTSEVSGLQHFNHWNPDAGVVAHNTNGPLESLGVLNNMIGFSETGASNGKEISSAGVLRSSRDFTGAANHVLIYNPNGLVGGIASNASATDFNTSSDSRKKTDIGLVADAGDPLAILDVPVRMGRFLVEEEGEERPMIYAQDLLEVAPDAVTLGEDGFYQVDYSKLVPRLLAALQALREAMP